jgi:hypothetical protein
MASMSAQFKPAHARDGDNCDNYDDAFNLLTTLGDLADSTSAQATCVGCNYARG